MMLETQNLILRQPVPSDWPIVRDFYMSERSSMAGGNTDLGGAWRGFSAILGHWVIRGYGLFAVTKRPANRIIGMVGPYFPEDWPERELGWTIYDGYEGQSLAHEAALAARKYLFGALGWDTAVSYIHPGNARSIRLAERLGAWHDTDAAMPKPDTLVYRHPAPGAGS